MGATLSRSASRSRWTGARPRRGPVRLSLFPTRSRKCGRSPVAGATLWTKDFIVGIGLSLSMSLVFSLLRPSMAGYAVARFSAGGAAAGFASSAFVLGAVVPRVITGKYLDFIGRRR